MPKHHLCLTYVTMYYYLQATSALDSKTEQGIQQALAKLRKDRVRAFKWWYCVVRGDSRLSPSCPFFSFRQLWLLLIDYRPLYMQSRLLSLIRAGKCPISFIFPLPSVSDQLSLSSCRIVERGTHDELLRANGDYAKMWQLQLKGNRGR